LDAYQAMRMQKVLDKKYISAKETSWEDALLQQKFEPVQGARRRMKIIHYPERRGKRPQKGSLKNAKERIEYIHG